MSILVAPMYIAEIASREKRGTLVSINQLNIMLGISVATIFPKELEGIGSGYTFLIFAFLGFLTLLFVLKFVPETKGKSLEELDTILVGQ